MNITYIEGNSFLHRLHPLTKVMLSLMVCVGAFAAKRLDALVLLLALDILIGVFAGAAKYTLRLTLSLIKVSLLLFVTQLLFVRSGNVLFTFLLPITDEGLYIAAAVTLRVMCATLPLAIAVATTKMSDLSNALVTNLYVPYKYAFALTGAIRFVPAFACDMADIIEAQSTRGVPIDTKNPLKKASMVLPLCVPLLTSEVRRIDTAATAARLRGFNLRTRECVYKKNVFTIRDAITLVFGVLIAAAGIIL